MTNVEALKNLYLALGGSAEDLKGIDTNAAVINLLAGVAGGGGGGGSTGGLVVNATMSGDTPSALDKTFGQIIDAAAAGLNVAIALRYSNNVTYTIPLIVDRSTTGNGGGDVVVTIPGQSPLAWYAASRDEYPVT